MKKKKIDREFVLDKKRIDRRYIRFTNKDYI